MALKINWHITIDQFSILTQTADNAVILERDFQLAKARCNNYLLKEQDDKQPPFMSI